MILRSHQWRTSLLRLQIPVLASVVFGLACSAAPTAPSTERATAPAPTTATAPPTSAPPPTTAALPTAPPVAPSATTNTRSPVEEQSSTPAASTEPRPVAAAVGDGRTHPGPYFLGRPDAPVTIDEYADFQ
jgi:cytoskeletal protein RodZ